MIVASVANIFLHSSALMLTVSTIGVGIFSAFILYDLKAVRDGQVTNYIEATLHVYLSLINLFQNLLTLLTLLSGRDR
ncbi:MAG: Bax inhibitor-1 family protein, partial [Paucibacter sp.]|nr:Bax inhibitor-1 family protein [Roseateles sp.]